MWRTMAGTLVSDDQMARGREDGCRLNLRAVCAAELPLARLVLGGGESWRSPPGSCRCKGSCLDLF